jgi:hypothetical protein
MLHWASRCVPGFSILALILLSFVAFADAWHSPPSKHEHEPKHHGPPPHGYHPDRETNILPMGQKIFIGISLFVHINALYFAIRLFFALVKTLRESKKILGRRLPINSKLSEDMEDETLCDPQDAISLESLGVKLPVDKLQLLPVNEIIHAIILPNYKEDFDTLRTTISVLASHPRAATQYEVSLAFFWHSFWWDKGFIKANDLCNNYRSTLPWNRKRLTRQKKRSN